MRNTPSTEQLSCAVNETSYTNEIFRPWACAAMRSETGTVYNGRFKACAGASPFCWIGNLYKNRRMEIFLTDLFGDGCGMMLGEVVGEIVCTGFQIHVELQLTDSIPEPIKTHVDGLG
jgi:hypothetical protein